MKEYDTWFELWGADKYQWHFIADFDTREQAEAYRRDDDFGYEETTIIKSRGTL